MRREREREGGIVCVCEYSPSCTLRGASALVIFLFYSSDIYFCFSLLSVLIHSNRAHAIYIL